MWPQAARGTEIEFPRYPVLLPIIVQCAWLSQFGVESGYLSRANEKLSETWWEFRVGEANVNEVNGGVS